MARVQYGAIVTELKGKIQGHVFQGGNVGFVMRNKGYTPGNSNQLRFKATARLGLVTSKWKSLSDANRAAWAALAPTWLFTNKFGASYQGSGFQIFSAYNNALLLMEEDFADTPDTPTTPENPGTMTFSSHTTSLLKFNIANTTSQPDNILLFASPPVSAGVTGSHVRYTLMDVYDYSISGPFDFRSEYLARYGSYNAGQRIFIKSVCRNGAYPYANFQQFASAVIT